jgi:hypothetical protein
MLNIVVDLTALLFGVQEVHVQISAKGLGLLSFSWFPPVLTGKYLESTSTWTITASVHIPSNSVFINHPTI